MVETTKKCSTCGEVKPSSAFYRKTASKDGLSSRCKECHRAYEKVAPTPARERYNRSVERKKQQHAEALRLLRASVMALEGCNNNETLALLNEVQAFLRPLGHWPYDKEE